MSEKVKMSEIKINYLKEWGSDGTVYTQTIAINKQTAKEFNKYIQMKQQQVEIMHRKRRYYTEEDLKILSLDKIEEGKNFTNLIMLDCFKDFCTHNLFLSNESKTFKRILKRNTIIKVI